VYAGWREMNDYMRENKLDPVAPQLSTETVAQANDGSGEGKKAKADKNDKGGDKGSDKADKAEKSRAKDESGDKSHDKARKHES
jgi:hypothetical protein